MIPKSGNRFWGESAARSRDGAAARFDLGTYGPNARNIKRNTRAPTGLTSPEADIAEPWADDADPVKTNWVPVQVARQRMSLGKEHSCAVAAIVMAQGPDIGRIRPCPQPVQNGSP